LSWRGVSSERVCLERARWPADDPRIYGKIVGLHGRKGTLKVKFKRGVPGQALNSRVKIKK